MSDTKVIKWVDLGHISAKLRKHEMPDGSFAIGLSGIHPFSTEWAKFKSELNFIQSASGKILLRNGKITINEIRRIFPKAIVKDFYSDDVHIMRADKNNRTSVSDTQASILLGKNFNAQDVFLTATGARYIAGRDGQPVSEGSISVGASFLRAKTPEDIDLCADGFVLRMLNENLRPIDIRKFCNIIFGETDSPVEATDNRLRGVQESIEAAIFRNVSREFSAHGEIKRSFSRSAAMIEHQPAFEFRTSSSIDLQQYSTPVTLSIAAQNALGQTEGFSVLEPTIGNASLVTMLRGADITGVEMDQARVVQTRKSLSSASGIDEAKIKISQGDFLESSFDPESFDITISNPPFGGLDKPVLKDGMRVTRLDHLIVLKSLDSRKADGRSVFIVGADYENMSKANEGVISGGSSNLFNWLCDHYEVKAVEIAGAMYRKQGAGYPTRMIAVGRRRTADEAIEAKNSKAYRITRLDVIRDNESLWAASESMKSFLAESLKQSALSVTPVADKADKPSDVAVAVVLPENNIAQTENKEVEEFGNEYQAQYEPMSQGNTTAMIPKNLAVPQSIAFERFLKEHGSPEEFVRRELQIDDLNQIAPDAPEQIDAIALAIANMKDGRALILADQTGMGKGRQVAAVARWSALNNRPVIFLTEKGSLFSDFWRDVRDIGSEDVFVPFILNEDTHILATDSSDANEKQEILINKTSAATRARVMKAGNLSDEGINLMFATYSQFNRDEAKSAKSRFIKDAAIGATIILDESHNAAGDSNTGNNIAQAVQVSHSAVYSSATYSKNASNMGVYYKAFPGSIDMKSLTDTLKSGGEPLQEVLSSMLCEDGVLVRREHDLSNLKFSTVEVTNESLNRNIKISDSVSEVLSMMAYLSGDVEKIAKKENKRIAEMMKTMNGDVRQGQRMGVSYSNFGSRLYNISRQIALSLSLDMVIEDALKALNDGKKPVIVLEQTMESIMSESSDDTNIDEETGEVKNASQITISSLLSRVLKKLYYVNKNNGYGVVERVEIQSLANGHEQAKALADYIGEIERKIAYLDNITLMPLDQIRIAISNAGYSCGEVSGRSSIYKLNDDGTAEPEERKNDTTTKLSEIFKFNNGEHDAVIITRSGCTGISMHSSAKFADRRQRILIEAQIANNVAERVQFFGRVNRRGQVSSPEIHSVTSGLPWENRLLAMQNMKMRKLTANVQSNRNSSAEIKGIPDILNSVGEMVCKEFLSANPEVMDRLSIDPESEENSQAEFFFANKLTGRMSLLPYDEQVEIYEMLSSEYRSKLIDLTNRGINPLASKILDVGAKVVERREIMPGTKSGSVFDAPVYAEKIEWTKSVQPWRSDKIVKAANASITELLSTCKIFTNELRHDYRLRARTFIENLAPIELGGFIKLANDAFYNAMIKSVPAKFIISDDIDSNVMNALQDDEMNAVKRMSARREWFKTNAPFLMPGDPIEMTIDGELQSGVIIGLKPPEVNKEHYLGQWSIKVAVQGTDKVESLTFNSLIDDENFQSACGRSYRDAYKALDNAPEGEIRFSRWTMSGNLFRASEIAANSDIGYAGIYTEADGTRHRAIICKTSVNMNNLLSMEIAVSKSEALEYIETMMANDSHGRVSFAEEMDIRWGEHGRDLRISVPGTKSKGGIIFLNKNITQVTGEFSGSRSVMNASFRKPASLEGLIDEIYNSGFSFKKKVETDIMHHINNGCDNKL